MAFFDCGGVRLYLGKPENEQFRSRPIMYFAVDDINAEDWTLNLSRYVMPPLGEDIPSLSEAVAAFKQAVAEARAAEDRLRDVLTAGGWLS